MYPTFFALSVCVCICVCVIHLSVPFISTFAGNTNTYLNLYFISFSTFCQRKEAHGKTNTQFICARSQKIIRKIPLTARNDRDTMRQKWDFQAAAKIETRKKYNTERNIYCLILAIMKSEEFDSFFCYP